MSPNQDILCVLTYFGNFCRSQNRGSKTQSILSFSATSVILGWQKYADPLDDNPGERHPRKLSGAEIDPGDFGARQKLSWMTFCRLADFQVRFVFCKVNPRKR